MKKTITGVLVMLVCVFVAFSAVAEKPTLAVSGKGEIWLEVSDKLDSNKGDSKITANELYVTVDAKFEKDVAGRIKFDGADIVSSDGKATTEKIVEEAKAWTEETEKRFKRSRALQVPLSSADIDLCLLVRSLKKEEQVLARA